MYLKTFPNQFAKIKQQTCVIDKDMNIHYHLNPIYRWRKEMDGSIEGRKEEMDAWIDR